MREVKTADLNYKCYFNVVIKNNNQTNDDINWNINFIIYLISFFWNKSDK